MKMGKTYAKEHVLHQKDAMTFKEMSNIEVSFWL
jgi:hypothetical protein